MPIKTIIDGALLAECEMKGPIRFGMHRVAEEINKILMESESLDINFANSIYSSRYQVFLKAYLQHNFPSFTGKIISSLPLFNPYLGKVNKLTDKYFRSYYPPINKGNLKQHDLFFSYYYPFSPQVLRSSINKCITLLDIIPLKMSGYSKSEIDFTRKIIISARSNYGIAISEFTKNDVCAYDQSIDPARIFVVPLAASAELFFVNRDKERWQEMRAKYQLPENYFLSVSSVDKRKNLPHLIKSFSQFILQQKPGDLHLVLTGNSTYGQAILDELNIVPEVRSKIVLAKSIANTDLSIVYSNAFCFFFMSFYEGFGLPVLEAMQCGTPVITSNATSLPEVVGDAGIMVSPYDADALCQAMNTIYNSVELRRKYAELGLERSKQFSWQKCANEYINIFKTIVAGA